MAMKRKICIALLMVMLYQPLLNAADSDILWAAAVENVKQGENDFAFMNFHMLVDTCPDSRERFAAELSLGEYYFAQNNFRLAAEEFENLCATYPKSVESLIASAYLYKIAQLEGRNDAAQEYRRKIISGHPVVLIFKEKEFLQYRSGFQHTYKVGFYIDRAEVLMDGKLFVEVRD